MAKITDTRKVGGKLVILGDSFVIPVSNSTTSALNASIRFNPTAGRAEVFLTDSWVHIGEVGVVPQVAFTPNSTVVARPLFTGTVTNPGGSVSGISVDFYMDTVLLGNATTNATGVWSYAATANIANGTHSFVAVAQVPITKTNSIDIIHP